MKKMLRIFSSIIAVALMAAVFVTPASAATGYQGYAIYRDKVVDFIVDNNWHAGIMYDPYTSTSSIPLIHTPGKGYVRFATWNDFMNYPNQTNTIFMGVYAPKGGIISADRDKVRNMAYKLATDQIGYVLIKQMDVNSSVYSTSQSRIEPKDITQMRCDGVVEYCFEYCNYRIFGDDGKWNISKNNQSCVTHHDNVMRINPALQTVHMTLLTKSKL